MGTNCTLIDVLAVCTIAFVARVTTATEGAIIIGTGAVGVAIVSVCGTLVNICAILPVATVPYFANAQVCPMKVSASSISMAVIGMGTLVEI